MKPGQTTTTRRHSGQAQHFSDRCQSLEAISEHDRRESAILSIVNRARAQDTEGKEAREYVLGLALIRHICRRVIKNPHGWWIPNSEDFDDLLQEVRICIDRYLPDEEDEFASLTDFRSWVKTLAVCRYIDGIRKHKRGSDARVELDANSTGERLIDVGYVFGPKEMVNDILCQQLLACLSEKDAAILRARYSEGLTLEQLSEEFELGGHREQVRRRIVLILDRVYENYVRMTKRGQVSHARKIATNVSAG